MRQLRLPTKAFVLVAFGLNAGALEIAAAGKLHPSELRCQRVGATTYFHVRFDKPADMHLVQFDAGTSTEPMRRELGRSTRLVPQDGKTAAVYPRLQISRDLPNVGFHKASDPVPVEGLEFIGKLHGEGKAQFLFLYATDRQVPETSAGANQAKLPEWLKGGGSIEMPVELDFTRAKVVALRETAESTIDRNNLKGLWAEAQAGMFATLEALAPDFSFYGFACAATGRKYGVPDSVLARGYNSNRDQVYRQLYDTTTGSTAITQSLQLHRMLSTSARDQSARTIDIRTLPGIDIPEHPWIKMMGGKRPTTEPFAQIVPHDNYYMHFKSVRSFMEMNDLLDLWGTSAVRVYDMTSRDYSLKEKYERQLCLKVTPPGLSTNGALVRSVAITGSDGYLREGSDVTVLFHVASPSLFYLAAEPCLQQARREYSGRLREAKTDYHGITVESYVTPLREVSLHRAAFGEFVAYSNSSVAVQRIVDTHQGRLKPLNKSPDFQYMRTVFRLEDENEQGFVFLSDAFIRQLVGPASKIKEKRRLEALTSLSMATNAALFAAWETGKLPGSQTELLAKAALRQEDLDVPEGKGVMWDPIQQIAVSDVYNTQHFPTPLVELAIDKITPLESQEYRDFRNGYLNYWRQYFDPVGFRFSSRGNQAVVETYILPLLNDGTYNILRQVTGEGTAELQLGNFAPSTALQGMVHLSPMVKSLAEGFIFKDKAGLGDWLMIRVDDSALFAKLAEICVQREFNGANSSEFFLERLAFVEELPWTVGIQVKDPNQFRKALADLVKSSWLKPQPQVIAQPDYRGVAVTRVDFIGKRPLYSTLVGGAWYIGTSEIALKDIIDRSKLDQKTGTVPINGSVYFAPAAAVRARGALSFYMEWQSHRLAMVNCPIYYALYQAGLIDAGMTEATRQAVARHYLGYKPVSPDNATYRYDKRTDEVVNQRHGSTRRPQYHAGVESDSPLAKLLNEVKSLRVDLRFREDGVHTTVTLERKGP